MDRQVHALIGDMPSGPATGEFVDRILRAQLHERRQKLQTAITGHEPPGRLTELLQEVDSALARMDNGTYGLCKACHEPIESERLISNPLLEFLPATSH